MAKRLVIIKGILTFQCTTDKFLMLFSDKDHEEVHHKSIQAALVCLDT